jgi:GNAT superfamily N-acetyltransferase
MLNLEQVEAESAIGFVEARGGEACWKRIGGAVALFDGAGSPLTQSFCLGLGEPATDAVLEELEEFFFSRGAAAEHEVAPLAGVETYALLTRRGYSPVELSSVLYRELEALPPPREGVEVRIAGPEELALWAAISADGWSTEAPELRGFLLELSEVSARRRRSQNWIAFVDGRPAAAAAMTICGEAVHMAGAATIPALRGRGAQNALLAARLAQAKAQGCRIAVMGAAVGSASQRNAERNGFRVAYTRVKWRRER